MGRITQRDHPEPLGRLVKFEATDHVELYGMLFEPRRKTKKAAIFLHGTGGASIFDSRRTNLLAEAFVRAGIAYFPFNNRGAHLWRRLRKRDSRPRSIAGGSAFERIRDAVHDIDGAVRELRARGYREITLIGHSTGANKIAVYDFYKHRNSVSRYIFLAGGDDVGLNYEHAGARRFKAALAKARKLRNSEELVPESLSPLPMSWRSWFDMSNPDGDYNIFPFLEVMRGIKLSKRRRFRHMRGVNKPSLVIYGENDEYCFDDVSRCVAILAGAVEHKPNFEFVIVEDADHGFGGREGELGTLMAGWIAAGAF